MAFNFGLSYLDALTKTLDVVKRDVELFKAKDDEGEFNIKSQVGHLMKFYTQLDPDTVYNKFNSIESNQEDLKDEINFIIKIALIHHRNLQHHPQRRLNIVDGIRFEHLLQKYMLKKTDNEFQMSYSLDPILLCFPVEEYEIKKENPSLCRPFPEGMKKFKNFKREYDVLGIFALLPPGKKYGGFVKALLNLHLLHFCEDQAEMWLFGELAFHIVVTKFRVIYNSSIFPNEKRLEWFNKLQIKENECTLWSQLFDKQYPGYKDIHKLFGQVA